MKHVAIFLVFVLLVVGLLYSVSGTKSPRIPDNENHLVFDREDVCMECHGPEGVVPRRDTHPPKDQCLQCHKVKDNRGREGG